MTTQVQCLVLYLSSYLPPSHLLTHSFRLFFFLLLFSHCGTHNQPHKQWFRQLNCKYNFHKCSTCTQNKQKQLLKNSNLIKSKLRKWHVVLWDASNFFATLIIVLHFKNILLLLKYFNSLCFSVASFSHVTICTRLKNINLINERQERERETERILLDHIPYMWICINSDCNESGLIISKGFEIVSAIWDWLYRAF